VPFRRKRTNVVRWPESSSLNLVWTPAFAGVTVSKTRFSLAEQHWDKAHKPENHDEKSMEYDSLGSVVCKMIEISIQGRKNEMY
jgi:hypothetical protein